MENPLGNIGNVEERLDELFEIYGKLAHHTDTMLYELDNQLADIRRRIINLERR